MWNHRRCIHVHIPKTAGNSISAALKSAWRSTPVLRRMVLLASGGGRPPFVKPRETHKHAKARDILEVIGEDSWRRGFSFAIVRNPWDLMVSSYHWWLERADRWEQFRDSAREIRALGSFAGFMNSAYGREQINEQRGNLRDWICDRDQRIVVDFVGRFERLEEDWTVIAEHLGITQPLPHRNRSTRGPYRQYYTSATRDIVARRFAWAIDRFEYRF